MQKLFFAGIALLCFFCGQSQVKYRTGAAILLQKESFNSEMPDGSGKNSIGTSGIGAYLGVGYKFDLNEQFNFSPELNYSMLSYKDAASKNATIQFLSVPLMFGRTKMDKLSFSFGPQIDYYLTNTHGNSDLVKRLQFGLGALTSYQVFDQFYLEARWTFVFRNKIEYPDGITTSKLGRNSLQIGASYRF